MKPRGRLAALFLLLGSQHALSEYRHRVLLLEHTDGDASRELTTRVRAELTAAGFDVVVEATNESDPKRAVENAGRALHPASVLLIEPSSTNGTELWLADRMLHKTVVLRLKPHEPDATDVTAPRVAVQAVELVKARLAELSVTREPEQTPAPPAPPPAPRPVATKAPAGARPSLTLALGLLQGFQKGEQAWTPVLRLGVSLPESWTGEVLAIDVRGGFVGLGRAARVERGAAAATLRHTAATLDAVVRFVPRSAVQPFVSLGGGLLAVDVSGDAPDPYRNYSDRTFSGLVDASGGVWLQPRPGVGLVLEGQLMDAWSKTVVRLSGRDAAQVAAPLLLASAGLMVEF